MNALIFPILDFNEIDITKIPMGSFVIGFDLNSGGKLSKIDDTGTVQVIEGAGGGGPESDPIFTAWLGTNPLSGFATTSEVNQKQDTLISGTNIKTIENQSILGSGNINLEKSDVGLGNVDNTSDVNKPISTATQTALNSKQDTLISGTNIKTINGESILGAGNILVSAGGERRHDFDSGYSYCGTAPLGSLESQEVWTIKRLTIPVSGENIILEQATLVRWSDRLIASYS